MNYLSNAKNHLEVYLAAMKVQVLKKDKQPFNF
jgi:hypothetical protein